MATQGQLTFLAISAKAAKLAGHIWPGMAACEAALESTWGTSELALKAHNLFGAKQQVHPVYGSLDLPTREFLNHQWVTVDAEWCEYPDYATSFRERMNTLRRLAGSYPHYSAALAAATPEVYVSQVSLAWSTDPERAEKCIEIYRAHGDILTVGLS
jgi:flagellum-specific peptidoglycan hydrolase FlgJ